jgi:hypothetical protein
MPCYGAMPTTVCEDNVIQCGQISRTARTPQRWSESKANAWYRAEPWLVGANYIPDNAINQLEMWQAKTFDPQRIDKELGWAEGLGMNTMRVFLHHLLWEQDAQGFERRIQEFLLIADRHGIRPMFVLFDSCWDPFPRLGPQHAPRPGLHNSGWVQSPGAEVLADPTQYPRLEAYVKGVVGAFAGDRRVLAWDVWNEPDNTNDLSYGSYELADKIERVALLLPKVFAWARSVGTEQPLTSGVWIGDWSSSDRLSPMHRIQLESSDVISFHNYEGPEEFETRVQCLQRYDRPILCTEYMARGVGSTFHGTLPLAEEYNVAVYNWGLVAGKTQTFLPWDSWQGPYTGREAAIWFHEIFHHDGTPYRPEEIELIRDLATRREIRAA